MVDRPGFSIDRSGVKRLHQSPEAVERVSARRGRSSRWVRRSHRSTLASIRGRSMLGRSRFRRCLVSGGNYSRAGAVVENTAGHAAVVESRDQVLARAIAQAKDLMDTTRAVAEHFVAHDIEAVTFVDTLDRVPFIHVTKQPSSDQSDLFGLDILTLIAYAASRTGALDLIEEALDLVDELGGVAGADRPAVEVESPDGDCPVRSACHRVGQRHGRVPNLTLIIHRPLKGEFRHVYVQGTARRFALHRQCPQVSRCDHPGRPTSTGLVTTLTATDGGLVYFSTEHPEFKSLGLFSSDGISFEKEAETADTTAHGYMSPVRQDISSISRTITANALEPDRRIIRELTDGTDLSDLTASADGEIAYELGAADPAVASARHLPRHQQVDRPRHPAGELLPVRRADQPPVGVVG